MTYHCPECDAELATELVAIVPEQTDLTFTMGIEPGQFIRAQTLAGVIENFAGLQIEAGRVLGFETHVFIAGLSYENDQISVTTRITSRPAPANAGTSPEVSSTSSVAGAAGQGD